MNIYWRERKLLEWAHWKAKVDDKLINSENIHPQVNQKMRTLRVREEGSIDCKASAVSNYDRNFLYGLPDNH